MQWVHTSQAHLPGGDESTKAYTYNNLQSAINGTGNIQNAVMNDLWEGQKALWNAILTTSPIGWETHWGGSGISNMYSTVKAVNDTVNGDGFDAGRNCSRSSPRYFRAGLECNK